MLQETDELALKLANEYLPFIESIISAYKPNGFGKDDLCQEGLIGLFDAMRAFSPEKGSFDAFAKRCIKNRIVSFVRGQLSLKNLPLSDFVPLENETLTSSSTPETVVIEKEETQALKLKLSKLLSPKEKKVLFLYLEGNAIKEIAVQLKTGEKSVENALFRVRRKLKEICS